jgi:dTMP kinase
MTKGRFITVEGSEGVGKSTNMEFIVNNLRTRGKTVVMTREPGGTPVAEQIRTVLLQTEVGSMSDHCELLLMFAARADHLERVIQPALEQGEWVVCDRFIDATYAYQGGGRGMNEHDIENLERFVLHGTLPDLTILLDAPPDVSAARRHARGISDRFEAEEAEFFSRVRRKYRERADLEPSRISLVDASGSLDQVQTTLLALLDNYFNNNL